MHTPRAVALTVAGFTIAAGTAPASASSVTTELVKLLPLPSEAGSGDQFGGSVALSPALAIVGSPQEDAGGSSRGAVYFFDASNGAFVRRIESPAADNFDRFGDAVAIDGSRVLVGASSDASGTGAPVRAGAVYVFDASDGSLLDRFAPTPLVDGIEFGASIDMDGDTAIIGAPRDDDNGASSGSAYLYDLTTGAMLHKLTASDGGPNDQFGFDVAIRGGLAIVGAPFDDNNGTSSGTVYVFSVATGQQLTSLSPAGATSGDEFGFAVDIDGDWIVVGTPGDNSGGGAAGALHVFDAQSFAQLGELTAENASGGDELGRSVSVDGSSVLGGATRASDAGRVFQFDLVTLAQTAELAASDGSNNDRLGTTVAMLGDRAVAGAPLDDDFGNSSGSAYLFGVPSASPCPTDLNGDGATDLADLLEVLASFGVDANGDTNADGVTDLTDLLAVLAAFGTPCD